VLAFEVPVLTVFRPVAAFLTAAVLLAGCGGGGGSTHAAPPVAPGGTAPGGTAPVTLTFIIPKGTSAKQRAAQSAVRRPRYITAATAAIKVTLTAVANPTTHAAVTPPGGLPQVSTFQVSSTVQNPNTPGQCGPDPANAGNIKCTETIDLPLGDDSLTIAAYDAFSAGQANGHVISQQNAVASVVQGQANTLTFTLDANAGVFTVTPAAGVTLASGANCSSATIQGGSDISATCTATITGTNATPFNVVIADAHGSTIPLNAPGAPVLTVNSSNSANFTATLPSGSNTLTITPHAVNVSAKITLTATPANTSGAAPGDGLSTIVLAFTVASVPSVSWKTRTATGLQREYGAAGVLDNVVYVAGGLTGSGLTSTGSTQSYDPSNMTWTTLANMNVPRQLVAGDALSGKFFVVGGLSGSTVSSANEGYDPSPSCVAIPPSPDNPSPPTCPPVIAPVGWQSYHAMNHARQAHNAVATNGRLYVFGGDSDAARTTRVATTEAYGPDVDSWFDLALMPTPRDFVAVAALNGSVYVVGGRNAAGTAVPTMERYDISANTWTTLAPLPAATSSSRAGTILGRIYVTGGSLGNGTYVYDPVANSWIAGPPNPATSNGFETSANANDIFYIINGGAGSDQLFELSSP
jgi:N-acetylneuraminic acid mutarotase